MDYQTNYNKGSKDYHKYNKRNSWSSEEVSWWRLALERSVLLPTRGRQQHCKGGSASSQKSSCPRGCLHPGALLGTERFPVVGTDCETKKEMFQECAKWEHLHQSQVSHSRQEQECRLLLCQHLFSLNASSNKYFPEACLFLCSVWTSSEHTSAAAECDLQLPTGSTSAPRNISRGHGRESHPMRVMSPARP